MKQATRILISLLLTAGFLFLFLRGFDLGEAWRSLRGAHLALILASVGVNLSAYVVRAWRWRHLLAPIRERLGEGSRVLGAADILRVEVPDLPREVQPLGLRETAGLLDLGG